MAGRCPPIAVCLLAVALTGCGPRAHRPRGGAEPAQSPPASQRPAGRLTRVGPHPEGIVVDPVTRMVAVATRDPAALVLLDARTGLIKSRIRLPGVARHLGLSAGPHRAAGDGRSTASAPPTVLVPSEPLNRLLEVALPSGRLSSMPVGRAPHDAAASAGRVFVGDEFGRDISVLERGHALRRIGGFAQPGGVTAARALVAVIDVGADTITLINPATLKTIGTATAGSGPTHGAADQRGQVFVADTRGNAILDFSTLPRLHRVARVGLPGTPYGIAVDRGRDRLWVTLTATNRLVEFAIGGATPRLLRSYPTGRQPDTVAVDPHTGRVFVACAGDGTVEMISPGGA